MAFDALRRRFSTLNATPYKAALIESTFDDTRAPQDMHMTFVLQTVVSGSKDTTSFQAIDELLDRLRQNWTWSVVLKVLLLLQHFLASPLTSAQWLKGFFDGCDVFQACISFQQSEAMWGPQAADHSAMVRRYAAFLETYTKAIVHAQHDAPLSKAVHRARQRECFRGMDGHELQREVARVHALLECALRVCVREGQVEGVRDFCELTAGVVRAVFRESLKLYSCLNYGVIEVLERIERQGAEGVKSTIERYKAFSKVTSELIVLCDFVKALPGTNPEAVPEVTLPPFSTLAALEDRLRTLMAGGKSPGRAATLAAQAAAASFARAAANASSSLKPPPPPGPAPALSAGSQREAHTHTHTADLLSLDATDAVPPPSGHVRAASSPPLTAARGSPEDLSAALGTLRDPFGAPSSDLNATKASPRLLLHPPAPATFSPRDTRTLHPADAVHPPAAAAPLSGPPTRPLPAATGPLSDSSASTLPSATPANGTPPATHTAPGGGAHTQGLGGAGGCVDAGGRRDVKQPAVTPPGGGDLIDLL